MADRTQRALGIARRTAHQHAFDRFADGGEVALPQITVRPDDPPPPPEPPPDDQGYWPEPYTMQPGEPYDPLAASAGVAPSGTPSLAQKAVDWWKAQPSWLEQAAAVHKQSDPTSLRPTEAEIDFASGMVGPAATEAVGAAKPFYSAVEQAVTDAKLNAGSPQQWLGPRTERTYMQKDPKTGLDRPATEVKYSGLIGQLPGVKPEEIEWLGLPDWLQSLNKPGQNRPPVVTKQDILDHIANNKVDVQEVMKGGAGDTSRLLVAQQTDGQWVIADERGIPVQRPFFSEGDANTELARLQRQEGTKFGTGMGAPLPGGENYRELLLTMPSANDKYIKFTDAMRAKYGDVPLGQMPMTEGERAFIDQQINAYGEGNKDVFRGSHWDEPNVLAHVRFDDRVVNGDRTLHMAEIQSDWHQKGRKQGYATEEPQVQAYYTSPNHGRVPVGHGDTEAEATAAAGDWPDILRGMNVPLEFEHTTQTSAGVPNAPFKTTWPELALKRMIRYAAENGYDRISWDSGATNAERYDLSKHVAEVAYNTEGRQKGTLQVFDHNRKLVANPTINSEKELADYIGKDAADKLLSEPTKKLNDQYGTWHVLSGLDLKVGGEGMKGFYDKMLPTVANKLAKKYGARVEAGKVPTDKPGYDIVSADGTSSYATFGSATDATNGLERTAREHRVPVESLKVRANAQQMGSVHTLKITPELRKAALQQGFPLFARGGKVTASQMARRHAHQDAFDHTFPR